MRILGLIALTLLVAADVDARSLRPPAAVCEPANAPGGRHVVAVQGTIYGTGHGPVNVTLRLETPCTLTAQERLTITGLVVDTVIEQIEPAR